MEGKLLVRRDLFCLLSVPSLDQEEIKLCKKFICSYSTRLAFQMPVTIALSIGSVISSDVLVVMKLFSLIFYVDTLFLKN